MVTPINELKSFTEYTVSTPTSVFTIGFQYKYNVDHVNVYVDGVEATVAGYTIKHDSQGTLELEPAVPSGVVRLERETNIDSMLHTFSAGAKFIAGNMDEDFQQVRHAQQEVRDAFEFLSDDFDVVAADTATALANANTALETANTANTLANTLDTSIGQPNGLASLDGTGKVPSWQLPAYVDDVLEFADLESFPSVGAAGVIYVALDSNLTYRWTGSTYVSIGAGSGVVDYAIRLYTPRNIGGVPFDGTADIDLPAVNTIGNQDTTGNASTATKLAAPRSIGGSLFDGTQDIQVNDTTKLPLSGGTTTGLVALMGSTNTLAAKFVNAKEKVTIGAVATNGTVHLDVTTQSVLYHTASATANFTLNVRGNASTSLNTLMSTGEALTVVFMYTNGATPYYASTISVDGVAVTPKWLGGTAVTSGDASSINSYTLTVIKTADAAFTVLASKIKYV